jgi:hypothetical protein
VATTKEVLASVAPLQEAKEETSAPYGKPLRLYRLLAAIHSKNYLFGTKTMNFNIKYGKSVNFKYFNSTR